MSTHEYCVPDINAMLVYGKLHLHVIWVGKKKDFFTRESLFCNDVIANAAIQLELPETRAQ